MLRQIEPKNTFSPHYILVHPNRDVHVHAGVQNYLGKPEKCFKNVDFGSTIKPTLCKKNGSVSWIFDPLSFKKETVETENSVENVKNPNVASDRGNDCTTVSEQNNQFFPVIKPSVLQKNFVEKSQNTRFYDLNEFGIFSGLENEITIKLTTLITSLQHKENVDPTLKFYGTGPILRDMLE